ncbi:MAG: SusE domain-containing protein [Muribaculaceae bacterium]|nr:SusE domain-containing protein [Muribaculaceae bacterium]
MKKISMFLACLTAIVGLSSCSQDRDPVLQNPTKFVLNTPALQNQYYQLEEGNTIELTCSQPDYGYSAIVQYSVEVSLTENFAEYETVESSTPTQTRMVYKDEDVAMALCKLHGFDSDETYQDLPAEKVYFRAVAQLDGIEGTMIKSNVVSLNKVKFYFAVPQPGYIYLVGSPEGWSGPTEANAEHYAPWRLFEAEDAIGSKIYTGTFEIDENPTFRFYTALTGWDDDSYGSQEPDNSMDFELVGNTGMASMVKGKGSFHWINWTEKGQMKIVVDMSIPNQYTVTVSRVD